MAQLAQLLALALAVLLAVAYRLGSLDGSGAFFVAVALGAIYTGHQLLSRLELPLAEAAAAVLARPESRPHPWTYWIYLSTLAITAAVVVQVVAGG